METTRVMRPAGEVIARMFRDRKDGWAPLHADIRDLIEDDRKAVVAACQEALRSHGFVYTGPQSAIAVLGNVLDPPEVTTTAEDVECPHCRGHSSANLGCSTCHGTGKVPGAVRA